MSFSLEDVRAQLQKLGYANVPDVVIDQFIARMKAKAAAEGRDTSSDNESSNELRPQQPMQQQQQQQQQQHQYQQQPAQFQQPQSQQSAAARLHGHYAPATLGPPVTHASPLSSLPLSSPQYSSLAQPLERGAPPPGSATVLPLPLSLRTNPAFVAQQAAFQPNPSSFVQSDPNAQHTSHYQAYQAALAQQAHMQQAHAASAAATQAAQQAAANRVEVRIEDANDDDEDARYYRQKSREIEILEARLKRHAAVAYGQPHLQGSMQEATNAAAAYLAAKENAVEQQQPRPTAQRPQSARTFGSAVRADRDNLAYAGGHDSDSYPSKAPLGRDTQATASAHTGQSLKATQPRSILRPSSAQLQLQAQAQAHQQPHSARPASAHVGHRGRAPEPQYEEEEEEEAEQEQEEPHVHAEQVDTQRSLRKTYAGSLQKSKRLNPRYGAGGYRRSDPVTRFHAFNSAWQASAFLNKKTTLLPQKAKKMQAQWQA